MVGVEARQRWAQDEMVGEEVPLGVQPPAAKEVLEVLAVPMDATVAQAEVEAPQRDATAVREEVVREGPAALPLLAERGWAERGKVVEAAALELRYSPSVYVLVWALAAGVVSSSLQPQLALAGRA